MISKKLPASFKTTTLFIAFVKVCKTYKNKQVKKAETFCLFLFAALHSLLLQPEKEVVAAPPDFLLNWGLFTETNVATDRCDEGLCWIVIGTMQCATQEKLKSELVPGTKF